MTTPSDPHSTDHNATEHNATEQSYPNYPSYPQQDVNPAEAQQEKQGSKKKRVVGYSVGAVILVVIIVVCALVFGKGTTSAKTADGLAEGLQANLRDGTGISEYLCEAPAQPLKYGALTPHLEGVMADETEQSQESADLQPFIDDMLKALSDNPNAEVKVAKKEDSKAIIVYNFHADDIKDKISDKSLSGIHMSREEGNHAIEEMTADRHTITYHAEKQDDKWIEPVTTVENVVSDTQCCSAEGTEGQDSDVRPWVTWVSFLARLVLAGIWIVSGVLKASNMMETRVAVRAYRVLPEAAVASVAFMLPALEILLGVLLLLGIKNKWMAIASAVVFTVFIVMIAQAWIRGLQIDCGCFGGGGYDPQADHLTYLSEIARDLAFMVFAVWLACFPHTPLAVEPGSRAPLRRHP